MGYSRRTEARREARNLVLHQLTDRQFIGYLRYKAVNRWRSWTVPLVEEVLAQTAGITRETAINFLRIYGTPTGLARGASGERCPRDFPIENSDPRETRWFFSKFSKNSTPVENMIRTIPIIKFQILFSHFSRDSKPTPLSDYFGNTFGEINEINSKMRYFIMFRAWRCRRMGLKFSFREVAAGKSRGINNEFRRIDGSSTIRVHGQEGRQAALEHGPKGTCKHNFARPGPSPCSSALPARLVFAWS